QYASVRGDTFYGTVNVDSGQPALNLTTSGNDPIHFYKSGGNVQPHTFNDQSNYGFKFWDGSGAETGSLLYLGPLSGGVANIYFGDNPDYDRRIDIFSDQANRYLRVASYGDYSEIYAVDTNGTKENELSLRSDEYITLWDNTGAEVMRLIDGNVGIHQASPDSPLVVNNNVNNAGDTNNAFSSIASTAGSAIYGQQDGAGHAGYFSGQSAFMNGNVGIGQDAPASTLTINNASVNVGDALNTVFISSGSNYPGGALYVEQTNTSNNPYAAYFKGPVTVDGVLRVYNTALFNRGVKIAGGFVFGYGVDEGSYFYRDGIGAAYGKNITQSINFESGANPLCYDPYFGIPIGFGAGYGIEFNNCPAPTVVSNLNDEWYFGRGDWKYTIKIVKATENVTGGRNAPNFEFGFYETGGRILNSEELDWTYRDPEDEHFDTYVYKFSTNTNGTIYYHPYFKVLQSNSIFYVQSIALEPDLSSYSVLNNEIDRSGSIRSGGYTTIDPSRVGETYMCPRGYVAIGVQNTGDSAHGSYTVPVCARY
ncbi:hypothetical protein ACFL04_05010, partial [Patescibacteria group bacterium]